LYLLLSNAPTAVGFAFVMGLLIPAVLAIRAEEELKPLAIIRTAILLGFFAGSMSVAFWMSREELTPLQLICGQVETLAKSSSPELDGARPQIGALQAECSRAGLVPS
jgi:hypothetical protein